jgi:hypothetical protein
MDHLGNRAVPYNLGRHDSMSAGHNSHDHRVGSV